MNCKNCGAPLPDGNNHCPKCGTDNFSGELDSPSEDAERFEAKGFSAKRKVLMIISAFIVLVGGGGAALAITNYNSPEQKLSRMLSLAESCVSEQNYDQAASEFQKALDIESTNANAYLGLADSYIALGDTNNAIEILQKGSEATGDQIIDNKLTELLINRALDTAQQHLNSKEYNAALKQTVAPTSINP